MRNRFEKDIYKQLAKRYGKDNVEYESTRYAYFIGGLYTPDFTVHLPDGEYTIETKGYFRPKDMRVLRAVKDNNPALDLRLIFQNDNKHTKTMRYSDWANKYDFPYAVGTVPKRWDLK